MGDVAAAIARQLAGLDPDDAVTFQRNLASLRSKLADLDASFRSGLASCASTDLVTSHNAFGYLAERYGLHQIGIAGLNADAEPSPGDLAAVTRFVRDRHVSTIYYETLASPDVAEAVAREAGVRTAVLDPIEGVTDASAGDDYLTIMRANLASLRTGQACS
jgi:zinc transport system substrate-binding protein